MQADALNWMTTLQSGVAASRRSVPAAGGSVFTLPAAAPDRETPALLRSVSRDRNGAAARTERPNARRDEAPTRSARDAASATPPKPNVAKRTDTQRADAKPTDTKQTDTRQADTNPVQEASPPQPAEAPHEPAPAARVTDAEAAKASSGAEAAGTAVAQQAVATNAVAIEETGPGEVDDAKTREKASGDGETEASAAAAGDAAASANAASVAAANVPMVRDLPPPPSAPAPAQGSTLPPNGVPGQGGAPAVAAVTEGAGRAAASSVTGEAKAAVSARVAASAEDGTSGNAGTANLGDRASVTEASVQGGTLPVSFADHLGRATATTATPAATSAAPTSPPTPLGSVPVEIGMRALAGTSRFDIRLDPIELGRIDVRLEIDEKRGAVKAHLTVDRPETLALLQRDTSQLGQALAQAGLTPGEGDINVSLRDTTQDGARGGGQSGTGGDQAPRNGGGSSSEPDPVPQTATWRGYAGTSGIDIRI